MNEKRQKDSYTKIEEANRKYLGSEKGKQAVKRYHLSDKGKEARQRYLNSEKGQMALLRYYLSDKGMTTRQRRNELNKLLTQCAKFLEDNPDRTANDFLLTLGGPQ